ncbi:MAG: GWxTD domain-containing protein [Candidatus Eisenbacteria bacterium]|uniref:GWxTD domain-containing protein n=1 Tax=Eiseniibacteriota bacterium TaxID=2212470 RepID=A0A7Y2H2N0_UNCEI|nr:GWxTD domain-containing protein [Candidatus Eisenbacteria bacterium]
MPRLLLALLILVAFGQEAGASTSFASEADSIAVLEELNDRVRTDRQDVESRRRLASYLADSKRISDRQRAAELLNEALLLKEHDADLWILLARLRKKQKFTAESRRAYMRALQLSPNDPRIWDEHASQEFLRFQRFNFWVYLEDALMANDRCLRLNPDYLPTLKRQVRIKYVMDEKAEVDSLVYVWKEMEPENPWPHLIQGLRSLEEEDFPKANREFETGLSYADSATVRMFKVLELVDTEAEELSRVAADSSRFVADFWRRLDPTPSDPINHRLLEHWGRLVTAELLFSKEDRKIHGWEHAPGQILVKYGLPEDWTYKEGVDRSVYRMGAYSAPSIRVRYGSEDNDLTFRFIDFAMNGIYVRPPTAISGADIFVVATPHVYEDPFDEPIREQVVELLRFVNPEGEGRLELSVALDASDWTDEVLDEPERLITQLAVYDSTWALQGQEIFDWTSFVRDEDGRLLGRWFLPPAADSLVVGLETTDLDGTGRAAMFVEVPKQELPVGSAPTISDLALLKDVDFPEAGVLNSSPYARAGGVALPNPDHTYKEGEPVGLGFEVYGLEVDESGENQALIRVSLQKETRRGLFRILLGSGKSEGELVFEATGSGDSLSQMFSLALPVEKGTYYLEVEVEDRATGETVSREQAFEVTAR